MGRSIITTAPAPTAAARGGPIDERESPATVDGYSDALIKLIPAEVIGVYLAMQSILSNAKERSDWVFLIVFLFGVFATYFYLRVSLKVSNKLQLLLSVGAFCVWAYSMVPEQYAWHNGTYAGLLLIGYTFVAPKISLEVKTPAK